MNTTVGLNTTSFFDIMIQPVKTLPKDDRSLIFDQKGAIEKADEYLKMIKEEKNKFTDQSL